MKSQKALLFACFVLVFFAYQINIGKASNSNETMDENSPLVEVRYLSDGTIERRYANGTVRHDYFVTLQQQLTMTETVTAATTITFIRPEIPDSQENPFEYTPLIFLFLCLIGARAILLKIDIKSLPGPKPVKRPIPEFPFMVKILLGT